MNYFAFKFLSRSLSLSLYIYIYIGVIQYLRDSFLNEALFNTEFTFMDKSYIYIYIYIYFKKNNKTGHIGL